MKAEQEQVQKFNEERQWGEVWTVKDLLLNMVEETGEAWNIIKWLKDKEFDDAIKNNKDKFEDFVGDQLFLILKIAYLTGVDSKEAFRKTMEEYEQRFPVEEIKGKHANVNAGGIDKKYPEN